MSWIRRAGGSAFLSSGFVRATSKSRYFKPLLIREEVDIVIDAFNLLHTASHLQRAERPRG